MQKIDVGGAKCRILATITWRNMFNFFGAPFQAQSEEKQEGAVAPPRPKSPPKYYEEWVTSKAAQHLITPARPASLSSSESHADDQWPVHDPEHGVLVGGDSDKGDLLLGTLEDIKTDLQKHARTYQIPGV